MKQSWEIKKLGEVCSITMGQSPSSDTYNDSEGLPFFQGNADFGKIHPSIRVYCNAPIRIADVDDILISVRAPIGAINIANCKCCIGRGLASIRNNAEVANEYIYHALIANKEKLIAQGTGSTFKSIGKEALKELSIPVPPREEQERIVEELDCLSGVIEKKREQLRELDALAQSIFYTMFGDPITNEKGWEVKKMGEVCKTTSGGTPSKGHNEYYEGGTIPWLRSGEVNKMYIYDTELFITEEGLQNSSAKWFPENTVVVAMYGATVGQVGILKNKMTTNQAICGIFPNEYFIPTYLYHFLLSKKEEYLKLATGGAQPNISQNIVRDTLVCCPPIATQQEFADKIEAIEKQKALIKQSITQTEELFNARMDYYFN